MYSQKQERKQNETKENKNERWNADKVSKVIMIYHLKYTTEREKKWQIKYFGCNNKNWVTLPLKSHFIALMSINRSGLQSYGEKKCARSFAHSSHKLNDITLYYYYMPNRRRYELQMTETYDWFWIVYLKSSAREIMIVCIAADNWARQSEWENEWYEKIY